MRKCAAERTVRKALCERGVRFTEEGFGNGPGDSGQTLDFHLPDYDLYIEVKRFHSPRIADQMARHQNVIAIQELEAAKAFAALLASAPNSSAVEPPAHNGLVGGSNPSSATSNSVPAPSPAGEGRATLPEGE